MHTFLVARQEHNDPDLCFTPSVVDPAMDIVGAERHGTPKDTTGWACGIVYALGSVHFLFDKSQTPSMTAAELCAGFGVSKSTGSGKAKVVRDALDMRQMDAQWYRPSKMEENPLAWMIMVDGFIVDIRRLSRAVQAIAYEKGLIPYIPGAK